MPIHWNDNRQPREIRKWRQPKKNSEQKWNRENHSKCQSVTINAKRTEERLLNQHKRFSVDSFPFLVSFQFIHSICYVSHFIIFRKSLGSQKWARFSESNYRTFLSIHENLLSPEMAVDLLSSTVHARSSICRDIIFRWLLVALTFAETCREISI